MFYECESVLVEEMEGGWNTMDGWMNYGGKGDIIVDGWIYGGLMISDWITGDVIGFWGVGGLRMTTLERRWGDGEVMLFYDEE